VLGASIAFRTLETIMECSRAGAAIRLATAVLLTLALSAAAQVASPLGEWTTEGGKARVRLAPCSGDAQRVCGVITWSYRLPGAEPGPLRDIHNRDPALRSRPIVGLPLLQDFAPTGPDSWGGGTIYDPESGKTYKSKMRLKDADRLEFSGCVLFFCQTQTWTRPAAEEANP
jgi:uncharacterized protein (DUF2147 family)